MHTFRPRGGFIPTRFSSRFTVEESVSSRAWAAAGGSRHEHSAWVGLFEDAGAEGEGTACRIYTCDTCCARIRFPVERPAAPLPDGRPNIWTDPLERRLRR